MAMRIGLIIGGAIGAAIYWIVIAHIAFAVTGTDPLDALSGGADLYAIVPMILIFVAGILGFAAISRALFRYEITRESKRA